MEQDGYISVKDKVNEMSMRELEPKVYDDGRTKQSFKNAADINKILHKAQKSGVISHLAKHEAFYGEFEAFDFTEAQNVLARAGTMFEELPSEIRSEFDQSPQKFFDFVNDPEHQGNLAELLPALAAPGRQRLSDPVIAEVVDPPAVPAAPPPGGAEEGGGSV